MRFIDLFEDRETHRTIIKVGVALLFLLELFIYLGAVTYSGSKSWVAVYDSKGDKIYQTPGDIMTRYERLVFENAYGPLEQYRVVTENHYTPFPFRAWLAIAVTVPIGLALLLFYLLRAYLTFMGDGPDDDSAREPEYTAGTNLGGRFDRWFSWHRMSVFHLGFLLIVCVLAFWLIPNYMAAAAKGLLNAIIQFKWFFLAVCTFLASLVVWIIYLRYRLSRRMMDNQMDLEKFRLEKQMMLEWKKTRAMLPLSSGHDTGNGAQDQPLRPARLPQDAFSVSEGPTAETSGEAGRAAKDMLRGNPVGK